MENILELENVCAGYNKENIIQNISFEIKNSESVLILGPNGSGKSTILKTIYGLLNPDQGRIYYGDHDITNLKTHKLSEKGISYLPQENNFFDSMTVEKHLRLFEQNNGVSRKEVYSYFPKLSDLSGKKLKNLSGGEQQMLALSRIILEEPKIALLDEPTAGLSPDVRKNIYSVLEELKESGTTILMVEQNLKPALDFVDTSLMVRKGEIEDNFSPNEPIEDLKDIYFG